MHNSDDGKLLVTIFTKLILEDNRHKWVRNASAQFSTSMPCAPDPILHDFATLRSRCKNVVFENKEYNYHELKKYGYNFGPSLQVIHDGWKNDSNDEFIFKFKTFETVDDLDRFIIHPWAVDSMLQTQFLDYVHQHQRKHQKRLAVPVQIESFTWWGPPNAYKGSGYVFIRTSKNSELFESHLYNDNGNLMVSIIGTEYMETTVQSILALIDSQRNPYPILAELGWEEWLGPDERRSKNQDISLQNYASRPQLINRLTDDEVQLYSDLNKLAELYMIKTIAELSLNDNVCKLSDICKKGGVIPSLKNFLRYIFTELVKDGWFTQVDDNRFQKQKPPPPLPEILNQIQTLRSSMTTKSIHWVDSVWVNLSQILTGQLDARKMLYPGDKKLGPAELFFKGSFITSKMAELSNVERNILTQYASISSKAVVRILECGARDGSATSPLIDQMVRIGPTHFEYTFTDTSVSLLEKRKIYFSETGISARFALFNLDDDPFKQGLIPEHYDIIVGSFLSHATRDIQETLTNLRKLLRPGGSILLTDIVSPNREFCLTFGGIHGYQRNEDTDLQPPNYELSISNWTKALEKCGFEDIMSLTNYSDAATLLIAKMNSGAINDNCPTGPCKDYWIILSDESSICGGIISKLRGINFDVQVIKWEGRDDIRTILENTSTSHPGNCVGIIYAWGLDKDATTVDVCKPFLKICQYLAKLDRPLKLLTVTRGNLSIGPWDFCQRVPLTSPLIGMTNVLANEIPNVKCKCVDIDLSESSVTELTAELFQTDIDVVVAYRNRTRFTPRLRPYNVTSKYLSIPASVRFQLCLPESRKISDLHFVQADSDPLGQHQVEIKVKACALNFLDVLMVTKPDQVFDKFNYSSIDIAGVVTRVGLSCESKIGDRVIMARKSGCAMPSHIVTNEDGIITIPDEMTMSEAATFPIAVLTANCLLDAAKPEAEDVVLIHTASGGVGLLAIQVAQHIGCTIVVTAGNDRKRNYLRSLGLKYIFNSRNTDYGVNIRETLGRGVTIVLNSLTGSGYKEATLALCDRGARFIEMSKINIWSEKEVKRLRPDIQYKVIDVSTVHENKLKDQMQFLRSNLFGGADFKFRPLPSTKFCATEIREAFEYMEKAKHIGKIVLTMPEPRWKGIESYNFPLFNERSTYLITGGFGGIGLEVAKWMASSGARNILLVGRSSPKPEALTKIAELQRMSVNLSIQLCDVGNFEALKILFACIKETMCPLRGIMHAAGLLDDGVWETQSWEKYQNVFQAKVYGAWNLHQLSLKLHYPLEHFVLFSSIGPILGTPGQSNYVAGNQYLDSLSHYRYSQGQPATCINWGPWGQVGLAAKMSRPHFKLITINQGLAALEHALRSRKIQIAAYDADLGSLKKVLISARGDLSDIEQQQASSHIEVDALEFWKEYDACQANGARINLVKLFVKELIRMTLKMYKTEDIGDDFNFQDLGMDSLLMVEMKNLLQSSFGKRAKLSLTAVKDCKTISELSEVG